MALKLMKLLVTALTTTNAVPVNTRFYYDTIADTAGGATLTIDAADFLQDDGSSVETLPNLSENNSYFNVYINGVLQMNGISTYTPGATSVGSLKVAVPVGGDAIPTGTPVVLEVINFTPASNTAVTT